MGIESAAVTDALPYIAAGALVGTFIGFTGVGGGSLMTPILMLLFGQSPAVAVGTDLAFSATTKLLATASFGSSRRIDWPIVGRLAIGSVPGAAAVVLWFWFTRQTPGIIEQVISRGLAVVLVAAAIALLLQSSLRRWGLKITSAWVRRSERYTLPMTIVTGAVLGVGVALTSVGAGALGVVVLLALYPLRLSGDRLVATDIAHALPVTLIAAGGHLMLGHIDMRVLVFMLCGSLPAVFIASRTALRIPPQLTNKLIAIMLAVVSERLLLGH
jgi:uncharacterized membrane protein YfcA